MSLFRRCSGILAAGLILFANLKGIGESACAVHQKTEQTEKTERAATSNQHDAHQDHGAATSENTPPPSHHEGCTCLEHCQSCPTAAFAGVAPALPGAIFVAGVVRSLAAPDELSIARASHALPFATAPPAIA